MPLKEISEELAVQSLSEDPNKPAAVDIDTVRTIADIIFDLIERCRERRDANQIVEAIDQPSFVQRIAVNRQVRRSLHRNEYRKYGRKLAQNMVEKASSSSKEDIRALVNEVDSAI